MWIETNGNRTGNNYLILRERARVRDGEGERERERERHTDRQTDR